ncbi:hypothetical protein Aduo_018389 [Ancylostoma duodenale]
MNSRVSPVNKAGVRGVAVALRRQFRRMQELEAGIIQDYGEPRVAEFGERAEPVAAEQSGVEIESSSYDYTLGEESKNTCKCNHVIFDFEIKLSFFRCSSNKLRLSLTVSIDGFTARRLSKREKWPHYLGVVNLPQKEADHYFNSILAGAVYSRSKPSLEAIELSCARLEGELTNLHGSPIEVEGRFYRGIADVAMSIKRARSDEAPVLRTSDSIRNDGRLGQNGVPAETSVMSLITPANFVADALHVCTEGITSDRMRDLFNPKSRFPELRMPNRISRGSKRLTVTIIEEAKEMADRTKQLWAFLAPQVFTMKTQFFFDHAMEELLSRDLHHLF